LPIGIEIQRILAGMAKQIFSILKRAVLLFVVLVLGGVARGQARGNKPNVLFILIDDMGYTDFSCFGGTRVQTPEIDRVAKEGIRFTQFYVNAPICSPSRVAFTTGQYPNRWGITSYLATRQEDKDRGINDWLRTDAPSLARMMQSAGYYTAHVGKWHMGGQRDVGDAPLISEYGFDSTLTSFEGLGERILPRWEPHPDGSPFNHPPTSMNAKLGRGEIRWLERHKMTEAFVSRTMEEMDKAHNAGKPFYINLWPDDVHSPNQAPPGMRGDNSPVANYLGVLAEVDRQVGRLFKHIREDERLRDNTIVLIASDNGPEAKLGASGKMRGSKGNLYEAGIRLPLIVWAPKRTASDAVGSANEKTVVAGMDFAPSILAMTGVEKPADVKFDGKDMSAVMLGKSSAERGSAVMWVRPPDRPGPKKKPFPDLAIREGDMKLLVFRDGSGAELFNVRNDPNETTNLAGEKPDVVKRMSEAVIAWDKSIAPVKLLTH
jgi:arylsulfatase A-like enzyme